MANKTLILSITKAFGAADRFSSSNPSIDKVGNEEIYQFNDELIFARDLITEFNETKTKEEIDAEICAFAKQVVASCQIKEVDKIIYFIHSEEFGVEVSYRILKETNRVKDLKERIKKKLEKELGSFLKHAS